MITLLLAVWVAAAADGVVGWRGDGTGVSPGRPPAPLSNAAPCFTTPLPAWSNGSPLVVGGLVCATHEPDGLTCVDAVTGRVRWTDQLDVTRAFEGEARTELAARLAQAEADGRALKEARASYGLLQREVRRSGGVGEAMARLEALGGEITSLQARVDGVALYRPSRDLGMVGYTSATPVSDGARLFALAGHGVVGAWSLDGTPLWTRWLGAPVEPMRGWNNGHASSPLLVDDVLIAPFGRLRGLSATDGRELWQSGPPWDHYGTPAVARVGGLAVLVTPGGDVVRARDGVVLASGLGAVYHVGPLVVGDVVYTFGNTGQTGKGALLAAHRLSRVGEGVRAEPLWRKDLPDTGNFGSGLVRSGARLWAAELHGRLWSFDMVTGEARSSDVLTGTAGTAFYASPVVANGRLYLFDGGGMVTVLAPADDGSVTVVERVSLGTTRATPAFVGDRVIVRTNEGLTCLGRGVAP